MSFVKCKMWPNRRHWVRGCPLTWVAALAKPAISREVCRACARVSASSFTRARCSNTVRSRSCTLGPLSVSACSHRAASCGVGAQPVMLVSLEQGKRSRGWPTEKPLPSGFCGLGLT